AAPPLFFFVNYNVRCVCTFGTMGVSCVGSEWDNMKVLLAFFPLLIFFFPMSYFL
ncbi:hypothetical protein V8C35DRAFT_311655, partial [Trichoderma chlorosporum]